MTVLEALAAYYEAVRTGDEFLVEMWLRHLEFIRDLQRLTVN